jgi:hypothetical protein
MKVNSKNCPEGEFLFCAVVGQGVLNEDASTKRQQVYEYKVKLEVEEKEAADLMDEIDELLEEAAGKDDDIIKRPYQTHDDYDGIPKGKVWIESKCRTVYEDKDGEEVEANVNIYDASGKKSKLPEGQGVGKGSTGKVFGTVTTWDKKEGVGATLWLSGVQIGDFVPYEFEDAPEAMSGSFKGFDNQLEQDESTDDEDTRSSRRSRRSRR